MLFYPLGGGGKGREHMMTNLLCLPDEVLFCWLEYCDNRNLRLISRGIYLVRNRWFRHKVLNLIPLNQSIWNSDSFLSVLISYIKELDSIRFHSRKLLYTSTLSSYSLDSLVLNPLETMEYICDSWEIIYSLLVRPIPISNHTISTNNFILPVNNLWRDLSSVNRHSLITIPFNVWICVKDMKYTRYINKIVIQLKSYETDKLESYFFDSYLHEFIKKPGIYCITIGDIPYDFLRTQNIKSNDMHSLSFYCPVNIHYYINTENRDTFHDKLKVLGYSFDSFNSYYGLIYFKVPLEAEKYVINKWGTLISNMVATYLINGSTVCDTACSFNKLEKLLISDNDNEHIDNNITFPLECLHKTQQKEPMPNKYVKDLRLPKLVNPLE